jgi:UDP-4-amino-4-deoxy-L-arabinose formyltransferase/UDP-glucuronic acid dehydrogenase (UDP-4-keto-hexauronic acid decarboxylating)
VALRVVLVGAESAAVQVLQDLDDDGHEVVAVLVEHPDAAGAGLARRSDQLGLTIRPARLVTDPSFASWLEGRAVDLLVNVHSLSIIHGEVARAPRIGSFNLHPGPLPAYAGLNVVSWAIARGETSHAVTLHRIEPQVDTGAIAYSERFPIGDDDTALTVFSNCVRLGVPLVRELVRTAERDPSSIPARAQEGPRTLYRRRDVPGDGRIQWNRPARAVHDLARACNFGPFPSPCGHPVALLDGARIEIIGTALTHCDTDAAPGTIGAGSTEGTVTVATADQWLALSRVAIDGRPSPAASILASGQVLDDGPALAPDPGP